jgi:predicted  nucleic acid-binding Zn-ribbon protein
VPRGCPSCRELARDVLASWAEREALRTELHFSETMHQADLDERVKIEKDCRALRERVAAAEKEITKVHNDLGAESMRCEKAETRVAALEEAMVGVAEMMETLGQWFIDERPSVPKTLETTVVEIAEKIEAVSAGVPVAEEEKT